MKTWWVISRICFAAARILGRMGSRIAGLGCHAESRALDAASDAGKLFITRSI